MSSTRSIVKKELLSYFVSPVAYFVMSGFLALGGFFFFSLLGAFGLAVSRYRSLPIAGLPAPNINQMVIQGYFHTLLVVLVFFIPLLTMRLFSEERKTGTYELLLTSPVSPLQIVLGKFIAVSIIVFLMMCLNALFPLILAWNVNLELLLLINGWASVFFVALCFVSLGMAFSACSENQIVAAILSTVTLLILYVIHTPAEALGELIRPVLEYISPVLHASGMIQGELTISSLVYFFSLILFGLFVALRVVESHRWR